MSGQQGSSACELFAIVAFSTLSMSINMSEGLLSGFIGILLQFYVLQNISQIKQATILVATLIMIRISFSAIKRPNTIMPVNVGRDHFDLMRSTLMTLVVICIFMCDFKSIWNNRFDKTENSGISLMDIGVPVFAFVNAFTKTRSHRRILTWKIIYLVALGFIRMGTIRFLKYDVSPLEYGIHLNFYFMLAIHELCHGIYRRIVDQFYLFDTVIGALVLSAYYKLTRFPFLEEYQRTTWLRQNIEGIYSIVPFFAFYLIVADFGRYYEKRRFKGLIIYVNTAIVMLIYAYMRITAEHKQISKKELLNLLHETRNNLVSRRSTNVFYVLWSLVISYVSFATSYTVCRLSPHSVHLNTMVTFVSRNMLIVFLAGNIGIIVSKSTGLCPHPLAANIIYLFSIFMLLGWIRTRIIRR